MTRPYPQLSPFALARGEATAGGGGSTAGVALPFKGAMLKLTADETLTSGSILIIPWDAEVYDHGDWADIGGNPTRLTVPIGVTKVRLTGSAGLSTSITADRYFVRIKKNGGGAPDFILPGHDISNISGAAKFSYSSPVLDVVAGDYFEMEVFQDSGGNKDVDAVNTANGIESYFAIEAVEATAPSVSFRGAWATMSGDLTSQNISGGRSLAFPAEEYDTDNMHDLVTNNSRITVPAGVTEVRLLGSIRISSASVEFLQLEILKNGSIMDPRSFRREELSSTGQSAQVVSPVLQVVEGDYFELHAQTEADTSVTIQKAQTWFTLEVIQTAVVSGRPALLHVRQQENSGTSGGQGTVNTFKKVDINTELTNEISGASLASGQITLPAGTYEIRGNAPAYRTNQHRCRLYDTTASAMLLMGSSVYSTKEVTLGFVSNDSFITGRFTLTVLSVLELQHRIAFSTAVTDFGFPSSTGDVEVYTDLMIEKIS